MTHASRAAIIAIGSEMLGPLRSDTNSLWLTGKLEEAGYILCTKSFEGRVPKTEYRLSPAGRQALERYLEHMEALIHSTREH